LEIKQQLRLSQQLVMTPQLQQAIKLLQMSRMELTELVQEELLENPILEDGLDGRDSREAGSEESSTIQQQVDRDDRAQADESQGKKDEIDWERYLENHAMQAPIPTFRGGGDEDMPSAEANLTNGEGLTQHLMWQVRMGDFV